MPMETTPLLSTAKTSPTRDLIKFIACNVSMASLGWHDGCPGALLPYLQAYYNLTYSQVSMLFIGSFIGYVTAALLNVPLTRRYGIGIVVVLGAVVQGLGSVLIVFGLPFSLFVVSYGICGFGLALQDAQVNTHASILPDSSTKIGIMHSIYGLSGILAPVFATSSMRLGLKPNLFYFTNFGWSILSAVLLIVGFRFKAEGHEGTLTTADMEGEEAPDVSRQLPTDEEASSISYILRQRIAVLIFTFIILYVGCEIGEAGWIVTFLLEERSQHVLAGYASAGFFAGLTISRVLLLPLNKLLGEHRAVLLYLLVAIVFQLLIWFIPNVIANVITVHLFGCMMGPMYPVALSLLTKGLPRPSHVGAIGLLACLGQAGSAVFPFVVGDLAEKYGVGVLQPVLVAVLCSMFVAWFCLPRSTAPSDGRKTIGPA